MALTIVSDVTHVGIPRLNGFVSDVTNLGIPRLDGLLSIGMGIIHVAAIPRLLWRGSVPAGRAALCVPLCHLLNLKIGLSKQRQTEATGSPAPKALCVQVRF